MNNTTMDLERSLARGPVEIRFIKLDGSERLMLATTNREHFVYENRGSGPDHTPGILRVWDLMNEGWRSVRVDRIISWSTTG